MKRSSSFDVLAADSSLKMWLVMMVGSVTYIAVFKADRERGKRLVEHHRQLIDNRPVCVVIRALAQSVNVCTMGLAAVVAADAVF